IVGARGGIIGHWTAPPMDDSLYSMPPDGRMCARAEFCFDQAFLHQAGYKINQIARSTGSRAAFLRMGEGKKDISQWILDA
ncbi:MAG: hypothetical protein KIG71_09615, partial [Eubacteriales bacterium]|nr:hypothetical protein [Eubacteriales bacterium]